MSAQIRVVRTPEECFDIELPGWKWGEKTMRISSRPKFFISRLFGSAIRMAYWDVNPTGSETVLLTHGEPSWSYLNRRLVQPLVDAGCRVIMFDQVGFGWSDKPVREEDYTYKRHVAWNEDLLFNHLQLTGITACFQDWGGLIGLRLVCRNPAKFARLVITNTALPTADADDQSVNDGFFLWKAYSSSGVLKKPGMIGKLLQRGAAGPSCGPSGKLSAEEAAAYQAPFPAPEYCAGAHIFPELVPTPEHDTTGRPQSVGGATNRALWRVLEGWTQPVLLAFAPGDVVLGHGYRVFQAKVPACRGEANVDILGAGHFVQDGGGHQLAKAMVDFIARHPVRARFVREHGARIHL